MSGNSLPDSLLGRMLASYGIDSFELREVRGGYRNVSHHVSTATHELNLILFKQEQGITQRMNQVDNLGEHVYRAGLPVRIRYDRRIMKLHGRTTRYVGLYHFLPGATIPWEAYTMNHIKLLGWALADFHRASRSFTGELPFVIDEYRVIVERIIRYFSRDDVRMAFESKCHLRVAEDIATSFATLLTSCAALPGQQALHMDFVRGNILFNDSGGLQFRIGSVVLCGIIDLEKAARGPIVFDIARSLAFLYTDSPKPSDKIYKYFITSGYKKRGGGDVDNDSAALLEPLVTMMLTYDLYKFLRDNPYESLVNNHHFCRTRDILIARKVLYY